MIKDYAQTQQAQISEQPKTIQAIKATPIIQHTTLREQGNHGKR